MKTLSGFLRNCIKIKGVVFHAVLGIALLLLLPAADALSLTVRVNYTINYYPPNPCIETQLGDITLDGTELGGTLRLYYRDWRSDRIDPIEMISREHPPNPCAESAGGSFSFDYNLLGISAIYASFGGEIAHPPDPGHPAYAFPEGTESDPDDPDIRPPDPGSAQPILLGTVDYVGQAPGPTTLPLFAFASPGVKIGSLIIEVIPKIEIGVSIDIKPGSIPNSINLRSAGVVPVAILSTADFSAPDRINPETISLAGAKVRMVGKSAKHLCHSSDVNADGLMDLVCQVETIQFLIDPGDSVAVLESQTYDGIPVRGEDSVRIVP